MNLIKLAKFLKIQFEIFAINNMHPRVSNYKCKQKRDYQLRFWIYIIPEMRCRYPVIQHSTDTKYTRSIGEKDNEISSSFIEVYSYANKIWLDNHVDCLAWLVIYSSTAFCSLRTKNPFIVLKKKPISNMSLPLFVLHQTVETWFSEPNGGFESD